MIEVFKNNISPNRFFEDAKNFVNNENSYFISYPDFLKYFKDLQIINRHNLTIGINFTYGWMPTIFDFRSNQFEEAIDILNDAKAGNIPNIDNLTLLKGLFNNSLVGTSKLLHFINPIKFAIWDSRVYRYLTDKEPYSHRIGNCNIYMDYLLFCNYLTIQNEFSGCQKSIEKKVGYSMSAYRIVELVMYLNGEKKFAKENQRTANSV